MPENNNKNRHGSDDGKLPFTSSMERAGSVPSDHVEETFQFTHPNVYPHLSNAISSSHPDITWETFVSAIEREAWDDVIQLMNEGIDAIYDGEGNNTLLHLAVMAGHEALVEACLQIEAYDPLCMNCFGKSPLRLAYDENNPSIFKSLLEEVEANILLSDSEDDILMYLEELNKFSHLEMNFGLLLEHAVSHSHEGLAKFCFSRVIKPKGGDAALVSALNDALSIGNRKMIDFLIKKINFDQNKLKNTLRYAFNNEYGAVFSFCVEFAVKKDYDSVIETYLQETEYSYEEMCDLFRYACREDSTNVKSLLEKYLRFPRKVMRLMEFLNLDVFTDGVCHGFSCMVMQYTLLGKYDVFRDMMRLLARSNNLQGLSEVMLDLVQKANENGRRSFSEEERCYIELYNILVQINDYQLPYLANSKNRHYSYQHEIVKRMEVLMPEEDAGKLALVHRDISIRSKEELTDYLDALSQIFSESEQEYSIILSNDNHTVVLNYNSQIGFWDLIDVNRYFSTNEIRTEDIASDLFYVLNDEGYCLLSMKIFSSVDHLKENEINPFAGLESNVCSEELVARRNVRGQSLLALVDMECEKEHIDEVLGYYNIPQEYYNLCASTSLSLRKLVLKCESLERFFANNDVNQVVNEYGNTRLFEELSSPAAPVTVKLLIDAGADVNHKNQFGLTPLHFAARRMDAISVCQLLKHGADINVLDDEGNSPLQYMFLRASKISEETIHMAGLLIDHGANFSTKNNDGKSFYDLAVDEELTQLVEIMRDKSSSSQVSSLGLFAVNENQIVDGELSAVAQLG